jgi:hypothetical protein
MVVADEVRRYTQNEQFFYERDATRGEVRVPGGGHITSMETLQPSTQTSGKGAMANDDTAAGLPTANLPQLRSGPLMVGGILVGIGAVVALVGMAVAGTHVAAATRDWIKDLETPPDQLARLKWEQAKSAVAAGSATWRDHPNASARLTRRASSNAGAAAS